MALFKSFLFLLLLNVSFQVVAQTSSPYQLEIKKEIVTYSIGLATVGAGTYFKSQTPIFTAAGLEALDITKINSFDRVATNFFSVKAHETSNYLWYGSQATPLLLLAGKESRREFGKIAILYGEMAFLTSGLTLLTKYTVRRPRPFNFDPNTSFEEKTRANAKASFISGHTSITASNCFFTAKVFADYYPDSKWKPIVWGVAATVPAITGYLRVRGGRHYPTDVIGGYIVGAAVGYLVPHWHRSHRIKKNLTIHMGFNSAYVGLRF